ncbi:MAG: FlgD immunoglobulin-like domain containing protein [Calditrichia bacterium]
MKRYFFLIIIIYWGLTSSLLATGIIFTFANGHITGTSPKFYEFDVMVQGDAAGTGFGDAQAYINYSVDAFGAAIYLNDRITVTKGTILQGDTYGTPNYSIVNVTDNSSSRVSITTSFDVGIPNELTTNPISLIHIRIIIQDESTTAGLTFEPSLMVGQQTEVNGTKYSPVIASDVDDTSLPVEISAFDISTISNGLLLNWTTESEINNAGFEIWRSNEESGTYQLYSSYANNPSLLGQGNSTMRHEYQFQDGLVVAGQTYWYKLADVDVNGEKTFHGPVSAALSLSHSSLNSISADIPSQFKLYSNYPNPFNPETTLRFDIPVLQNSESSAQLMVYNILGQAVKRLFNGRLGPGSFEIRWDGRTDAGNHLPGGIYYAVLTVGSYREIIKMTLVK